MDPNMAGMATSGGGRDLLDIVLIIWFILAGLSAAYVAGDAFANNPELTVMKWGWILVTLYTGPVGAALYILSCKPAVPSEHADFVRPMWKQALGSTIHCLAGDATGIIVAATITTALGLPMWVDTLSEYVFGFAFGLLIFQALFMKDMLGGSYIRALRASFMPEWLSMNTVMAGMIPTMVILMSRDMRAMEPTSLRYWGVMALATLVGLIVAYPVNWWLVAKGLKHGMGTTRALGKGGHSMATERARSAGPNGARATGDATMAPAAEGGMPGMGGL